MKLLSYLRTQALEWWQGLPLPALDRDSSPTFQTWSKFDESSCQWAIVDSTSTQENLSEDIVPASDPKLVLITWNVDSAAPRPEARISAVISYIQRVHPAVDILFFQEVSRPALLAILAIPWIREHWYLSDADTVNCRTQSFTSVTLMSKSRFTELNSIPNRISLGPVWRVKYPSHFDRDALCCDILLPSSSSSLPNSVLPQEN
ncbi:predicted protein [Uncinocarpus reesii 1704]|uniref:Endonuclease/exonuclease/phosphatase domain-containing protein n=1 Tax=Uncinocarpus reesii (strain UAMH 1704) TaxID=336963 RepID=C4JZX6_UNCRE|nr:uncharacterized protein UREG_07727 [Uncinocarpus reesii 1704]EEP82862.1 predicted protein [Uncinocarpus reesii 1704]